jgi:MtN3 and saliva related transmembrane protein
MQWIDYLGLIGVVTGSLTFVPQVYKAWKSRSVGDLSIWMVLILLTNVCIWLVYGIVKEDLAMILANSIILFLSLVMLYFKLTFQK